MAKPEKEKLTELELQIMQVIWKLGPSGVSVVREDLEQRLAYTTVQTMLNILTKKGKLRRKLRGQAYEYTAIVTEARASTNAVSDLIDRMFRGSSEALVMSLIKNKKIDAKKIAELSKRLEEEGGFE
jgi:predicted transcriptional regulator